MEHRVHYHNYVCRVSKVKFNIHVQLFTKNMVEKQFHGSFVLPFIQDMAYISCQQLVELES